MKAPVDRTLGVLRVTCPNCEHVNGFPDFDEIFIFICRESGEPVEVEETKQ